MDIREAQAKECMLNMTEWLKQSEEPSSVHLFRNISNGAHSKRLPVSAPQMTNNAAPALKQMTTLSSKLNQDITSSTTDDPMMTEIEIPQTLTRTGGKYPVSSNQAEQKISSTTQAVIQLNSSSTFDKASSAQSSTYFTQPGNTLNFGESLHVQVERRSLKVHDSTEQDSLKGVNEEIHSFLVTDQNNTHSLVKGRIEHGRLVIDTKDRDTKNYSGYSEAEQNTVQNAPKGINPSDVLNHITPQLFGNRRSCGKMVKSVCIREIQCNTEKTPNIQTVIAKNKPVDLIYLQSSMQNDPNRTSRYLHKVPNTSQNVGKVNSNSVLVQHSKQIAEKSVPVVQNEVPVSRNPFLLSPGRTFKTISTTCKNVTSRTQQHVNVLPISFVKYPNTILNSFSATVHRYTTEGGKAVKVAERPLKFYIPKPKQDVTAASDRIIPSSNVEKRTPITSRYSVTTNKLIYKTKAGYTAHVVPKLMTLSPKNACEAYTCSSSSSAGMSRALRKTALPSTVSFVQEQNAHSSDLINIQKSVNVHSVVSPGVPDNPITTKAGHGDDLVVDFTGKNEPRNDTCASNGNVSNSRSCNSECANSYVSRYVQSALKYTEIQPNESSTSQTEFHINKTSGSTDDDVIECVLLNQSKRQHLNACINEKHEKRICHVTEISKSTLKNLRKCTSCYVVLRQFHAQSQNMVVRMIRKAKYSGCQKKCRESFLVKYVKQHGDRLAPLNLWKLLYCKPDIVSSKMDRGTSELGFENSNEINERAENAGNFVSTCSGTCHSSDIVLNINGNKTGFAKTSEICTSASKMVSVQTSKLTSKVSSDIAGMETKPQVTDGDSVSTTAENASREKKLNFPTADETVTANTNFQSSTIPKDLSSVAQATSKYVEKNGDRLAPLNLWQHSYCKSYDISTKIEAGVGNTNESEFNKINEIDEIGENISCVTYKTGAVMSKCPASCPSGSIPTSCGNNTGFSHRSVIPTSADAINAVHTYIVNQNASLDIAVMENKAPISSEVSLTASSSESKPQLSTVGCCDDRVKSELVTEGYGDGPNTGMPVVSIKDEPVVSVKEEAVDLQCPGEHSQVAKGEKRNSHDGLPENETSKRYKYAEKTTTMSQDIAIGNQYQIKNEEVDLLKKELEENKMRLDQL